MVNSQAKTSVLELTANSPSTQVIPSRGSRITDALMVDLVGENNTPRTIVTFSERIASCNRLID